MNALEIKGLSYSYPGGHGALHGVDLEIEKGMRVAIVGKNGSGKTTLLLHIMGFLDGEGRIAVMEMVRSRRTIKDIRRMVGCLFSQVEYQFIMPDLVNDIILSLPENAGNLSEKHEIAMRWLDRFNLSRYARSNPLDLSSGEMKRAALAGVLAREPELLLLDEPLTNLDRENSVVLIDLLKSFPATMLIATHRRFLVEELATHVAVMDAGKISGFYARDEALASSDVRGLVF